MPRIILEQNYYWLEMMARLRPGVSLSQAQASLSPLFHRWVETTAANDRERAHLPELLIREGATGLDAQRECYASPDDRSRHMEWRRGAGRKAAETRSLH